MVICCGYWHLTRPHTDKAILGNSKGHKRHVEGQRERVGLLGIILDCLPREWCDNARPTLTRPMHVAQLGVNRLCLPLAIRPIQTVSIRPSLTLKADTA